MPFVWFKHVNIHGSSMGSNREFKDMMAFISEKELVPIVSKVFLGLESYQEAMAYLESGEQLGKVVIAINPSSSKL
jgi:zinc-binding alcohol dehydrogenase/oxidoreductase